MHIVENRSKQGKKIYHSVLLRESYRVGGKVRKRTIANLSSCKPEEIAAIKLALAHKDNLAELGSLKEQVDLEEGLAVGAAWTVYQLAKRIGIERALGNEFAGKLALWQVIARVLDQGSRLSAVRLAKVHALGDVLALTRGFDENDLYENLRWLADHQAHIEKTLFSKGRTKAPELFLYDVTSSYLEGQKNFFGAYGYNRDGKRGKKQIVIGLLCDERGEPVSTEVFAGNTHDTETFDSQVAKALERFACHRVTLVGDRGMIKTPQIKNLPEGFHYITAITKPQIRSLLAKGVIQLDLFDRDIAEVAHRGLRYILRRNPVRVEEIRTNRMAKLASLETLVSQKNGYLGEHARARVATALKDVEKKLNQFKLAPWVHVDAKERRLSLTIDEEALKEASLLDGCYVIKTDLPREAADTQVIHDRYKDLAMVEKAFRSCKTDFLEVRPVHVQREKSTRGHVLVVMLAYTIVRALREAWGPLDVTVEEGLRHLSTLCSIKMTVKNHPPCLKIPRPRETSRQLLKALGVSMPLALPHREIRVVTRKKLTENRNLS
jgi:hypothetical protein